jgi:hypothetical protein
MGQGRQGRQGGQGGQGEKLETIGKKGFSNRIWDKMHNLSFQEGSISQRLELLSYLHFPYYPLQEIEVSPPRTTVGGCNL